MNTPEVQQSSRKPVTLIVASKTCETFQKTGFQVYTKIQYNTMQWRYCGNGRFSEMVENISGGFRNVSMFLKSGPISDQCEVCGLKKKKVIVIVGHFSLKGKRSD